MLAFLLTGERGNGVASSPPMLGDSSYHLFRCFGIVAFLLIPPDRCLEKDSFSIKWLGPTVSLPLGEFSHNVVRPAPVTVPLLVWQMLLDMPNSELILHCRICAMLNKDTQELRREDFPDMFELVSSSP